MQKLQLSIPEPCHENWQNMTPTEQGRFCNACAKEVIDFSTMTDMQVLNYFNNLTHEKVCGRALPEQLDRVISRPEPPKKKLFWYWNYLVMCFMFLTKGNNAQAQTSTKPATEMNPVKAADTKGDVVMRGVGRPASRVITGKVTDKDGNPVSFASVNIKGANVGISSDANGLFTVKVQANELLIISAAGYQSIEYRVGNEKMITAVLKKGPMNGGISWIENDDYYGRPDKLNRVAVLQIKDENTDKPLADARIIIKRQNAKSADMAQADKKGMYKIKGIKNGERYHVKIDAAGYEPNEFTIDEHDFNDRKKVWDVLLRKQKERPQNNVGIKAEPEKVIRVKGALFVDKSKGAIYVVDGIKVPYGTSINPDDVADYSVLQGPAAMALFGQEGANGAVIITTRQSKEIKMEEVAVKSDFGSRRIAGAMTYGRTIRYTIVKDSIATAKTWLNSSVKIYPNPVQRSSTFSIALKLPEAGFYNLQFADVSGKVLSQQRINANFKDHTEQVVCDARWAAGMYYIRVFDNKNKLISKSSFIVK